MDFAKNIHLEYTLQPEVKKTLSILKEPQEKKIQYYSLIRLQLFKGKSLFLPNWQIQSSKFRTKKNVFIQSKSKGQRNLNMKTHTFTQMLDAWAVFHFQFKHCCFIASFICLMELNHSI